MSHNVTKNFSQHELACPCCGSLPDAPEFFKRLQELRNAYGKPMRITSGHRCAKHNAAVGGAANSAHLQMAVDVAVAGTDAFDLVDTALAYGFKGIGIQQKGEWSKRFIHLDLRGQPDRRIWSY